MIVWLLRPVVRLVALVLLGALAVAGLAVAVMSIPSGGLASLAGALGLADLRDTVGGFLADLEADGPVAVASALAGAGALVAGLLVALGALAPRRERLLYMRDGEPAEADGSVAARRRALAAASASLARRANGITDLKVRVRPRRRRVGGRLSVRADRSRRADPGAVREGVRRELDGLSDAFALRLHVSTRRGGKGARAE